MSSTVVFDNGAYMVKAGLSTCSECRVISNSVIKAKNVRSRIFIGDQIDDCKDLSGLYYLLPFQKGYLVNWEVEKQVFDHILAKDDIKVNCSESSMIITEPLFNFQSVKETMNELLFEEYDFLSVFKCSAPYLAYMKYKEGRPIAPLCCLVVDSGYSFTHIVPFCNGKHIPEGIKRINVGGKILTNHLKEIISYRQIMVMDETYVINQMKEDVCYVSTEFSKDMDLARKRGMENSVIRDYVLPDYTHITRGYVRPPEETTGKPQGGEQIIIMNNERFTVPEILFHPSDIGIPEKGIAEAIVESLQSIPEEMQPHFYMNIILMGGNCCLPGFRERVYQDLRPLVPDDLDVNVYLPPNPVTSAWEGGVILSQNPAFKNLVVTKREYEEKGHDACTEKFSLY